MLYPIPTKDRNAFAKFLNEIFGDVEMEPCLQILQQETFSIGSTTADDDVRLKGKRF